MNIVEKRLDELTPYENNPRINDNAVEYVANSIKEFGFRQPIVIDRNNVIIAGHTRYKASQKLGLKTVPCEYADDLDEEQVKAYRLADNKVAEIANWDLPMLELELGEIELDMEQFGFETVGFELEDDTPDLSDNLTEHFECIIECESEEELEKTYNEMVNRGYKCRLSTL